MFVIYIVAYKINISFSLLLYTKNFFIIDSQMYSNNDVLQICDTTAWRLYGQSKYQVGLRLTV